MVRRKSSGPLSPAGPAPPSWVAPFLAAEASWPASRLGQLVASGSRTVPW
jgi:hypothetical protein